MASVDSIEVLDQPIVRGVPKRVKNGVFRDFSSKMTKSDRSIFEDLKIFGPRIEECDEI
jgi:hypothetical protein